MNISLPSKSYSKDKIFELVHNHVQEGLQFSFKSPEDILPLTDAKLNKLAIDVTAFANTIGGLIIFGIEKKRGKAEKFIFHETLAYLDAAIINFLETRIQKPIDGLKVEIISVETDGSILVIYVPESTDAPHMADDGRYYVRKKAKIYTMEEHEVRHCYYKKTKTSLELIGVVNSNGIPTLSNGKFVSLLFLPRFIFRNSGQKIVKDYKFEIRIPSSLCDENYFALNTYFSRHEGNHNVYSIPGKVPLFQEETYTVSEAKLVVTSKNFQDYAEEKIFMNLFYPDGTKSAEFNIADTFQYNGKPVFEADFIRK